MQETVDPVDREGLNHHEGQVLKKDAVGVFQDGKIEFRLDVIDRDIKPAEGEQDGEDHEKTGDSKKRIE